MARPPEFIDAQGRTLGDHSGDCGMPSGRPLTAGRGLVALGAEKAKAVAPQSASIAIAERPSAPLIAEFSSVRQRSEHD